MIANVSGIQPMTLQSPTGTYGTVPPPTGTAKTGINMTAPQWISSSTQQPVLRAPAPTSSTMPLAAPTSPATAQTPAPAPTGAAPPRGTPTPAAVNPSLAGTSTLSPPPGVNVAPQIAGGQQFQPADVPRGTVPAGTSAVSGGEVPYHIDTTQNANTTGILSKLATEAGRQLDQPTVWDDPLAKQIKDSQVAGINANYDTAGRHLDASLADRGINYSTIAGGDIMDLEKQRAGELSGVDASIAQQRANALAAGRSAAFQNASGYVGTQTGADQTARGNQETERNYADTLRNQAQGAAMAGDQNFQSLLGQIYGAGTGSQAGAAGIYGGQGATAAAGQQQDQQGLAELAQLAAQFFGQKAA